MEPGSLGRLLVGAGVVLVGLLVQWMPSVSWLGRLPGDIRVERPGFRVYFPVMTCLVVSGVISAAVFFISKWR